MINSQPITSSAVSEGVSHSFQFHLQDFGSAAGAQTSHNSLWKCFSSWRRFHSSSSSLLHQDPQLLQRKENLSLTPHACQWWNSFDVARWLRPAAAATGEQLVFLWLQECSVCVQHTVCLSTHTAHIYVCVVRVDCRMRVAGRDSLPVLFTGAHQTHASTWQSCCIDLKAPQSHCIQHTVKTMGSEGGDEHLWLLHDKKRSVSEVLKKYCWGLLRGICCG